MPRGLTPGAPRTDQQEGHLSLRTLSQGPGPVTPLQPEQRTGTYRAPIDTYPPMVEILKKSRGAPWIHLARGGTLGQVNQARAATAGVVTGS